MTEVQIEKMKENTHLYSALGFLQTSKKKRKKIFISSSEDFPKNLFKHWLMNKVLVKVDLWDRFDFFFS